VTSSTAPSINRGRFYVELLLFTLLVLVGADWLGDVFSSIWLNLAVGALFYPVLGLLPPKSSTGSVIEQGYLGFKYPYLPFWMSLICFAAAVGFLVLAQHDAPRAYKWGVMSGVFLWTGIGQLKLWRKVGNVSAANE